MVAHFCCAVWLPKIRSCWVNAAILLICCAVDHSPGFNQDDVRLWPKIYRRTFAEYLAAVRASSSSCGTFSFSERPRLLANVANQDTSVRASCARGLFHYREPPLSRRTMSDCVILSLPVQVKEAKRYRFSLISFLIQAHNCPDDGFAGL